MIRNNELTRLDFPDPVLPTMPTFDPAGIERSIFLRTNGRSGR